MGHSLQLTRYNELRKSQQLERAHRAAALYLEGMSYRQIAESLDVSLDQAKRAVARAKELWIESAKATYDQVVAKELARLDKIECEAWEAWHKSKQAARSKSETESQPENEDGKKYVSTTKRTDSQFGDPRLLAVVQKCIEQRMRLLGLDGERDKGGEPPKILEVIIESRDQVQEILPYSQFRGHQPTTIDADGVRQLPSSSAIQ